MHLNPGGCEGAFWGGDFKSTCQLIEMSEHVERVSANAPAKGQLNKDKNPELSKSGHSEDFILSVKEATGGF